MLKQVRHCDRCYEIIPDTCKHKGLISYSYLNPSTQRRINEKDKDLCKKCAEGFVSWLRKHKTEE